MLASMPQPHPSWRELYFKQGAPSGRSAARRRACRRLDDVAKRRQIYGAQIDDEARWPSRGSCEYSLMRRSNIKLLADVPALRLRHETSARRVPTRRPTACRAGDSHTGLVLPLRWLRQQAHEDGRLPRRQRRGRRRLRSVPFQDDNFDAPARALSTSTGRAVHGRARVDHCLRTKGFHSARRASGEAERRRSPTPTSCGLVCLRPVVRTSRRSRHRAVPNRSRRSECSRASRTPPRRVRDNHLFVHDLRTPRHARHQ